MASLVESELFGYEKGAFTGAEGRKIGRFEVADGGTVFLDEIGEVPLEMQSKLLRVLQECVLWRLGSQTETKVDVRVIAATNRDLRQAMQEQRFRPDLYFRLAVFPIEVPPLRQRREDIPLLVRHFVAKKQTRLGRPIPEIPRTTLERLMAYPWPGNVRELENVVERSLILSPGSILTVEPLPGAFELPRAPPSRSESLTDFERSYILGILEECQWQIKGPGMAAERLGMNPSTLYSRMKKLGLRRPE
jgi:formate hydrogenlyase transcriptional activator